jgi:hypothetical protein
MDFNSAILGDLKKLTLRVDILEKKIDELLQRECEAVSSVPEPKPELDLADAVEQRIGDWYERNGLR